MSTLQEKLDELIADERGHAVERGTPDDPSAITSAIVRDILRTKPKPWCSQGPLLSKTDRANGTAENGEYRCFGASCPHCIEGWITRLVERAVAVWEFTPTVYRHVMTRREWRLVRGTKVRAAYSGECLAILQTDMVEAFVPGPVCGGEPIPSGEVVEALFGAILRTPAYKRRRYSTKIPKLLYEPSGKHVVKLPRGVTPEDACVLDEQALGRGLYDMENPEVRSLAGPFYKRWKVKGLSPEEVDRIDEAKLPLEQLSEMEAKEERRGKKMARDRKKLLRELAASGDPAPMPTLREMWESFEAAAI